METMGKKIREAMVKKGYKQKDLARLTGKTQQLINDWVNDRRVPTVPDFIVIVNYLDLVEDFFPDYKKATTDKYVSQNEVHHAFKLAEMVLFSEHKSHA